MLDIALERDLIELLATNFKSTQIEELGRLLLQKFDLYELLNEQNHVTIPARRAAQLLIERCRERSCFPELIHLLVETDGSQFMGRAARVEGIEIFLQKLTRSGLVYDFDRRRVIRTRDDPFELHNWGSLRDGKQYPTTVVSIDIVGSSSLSRRYGAKKVSRALFRFDQYLKTRLRHYNGRVWSWNGDGGVMAFVFKDHEMRAVQFALELQLGMPVFNSQLELPDDAELVLRIGLDNGRIPFASDTGSIVSDVINYACHLEKTVVPPGSVGLSGSLGDVLPARLAAPFTARIDFEDRDARYIPHRIDTLRGTSGGGSGEPELVGRIAAG